MAPMMSWTRNGVNVPPITSSSDLFRELFVAHDADARRRTGRGYDVNGSILDAVREQTIREQLAKHRDLATCN